MLDGFLARTYLVFEVDFNRILQMIIAIRFVDMILLRLLEGEETI